MASKIYLPLVTDADPAHDVIFTLTGKLPTFRGNEDENLACPGCKEVNARNMSTRTVAAHYAVAKRLVFECPCGTACRLPATVDPATPQFP